MKNTAPDSIRETLFGDCPLDQWPPDGAAEEYFPWSAFVLARSQFATGRQSDAFTLWRAVVQHAELEPRQYLQAWHFLRQRGLRPPPHQAKQVLGVIVEVAMAQDLDLLAAYPDHSARYYNYSGAGVVWEHPDQSLDSAIDHLVEASKQVVAKIGPGEEERPAPPPPNSARLSFLTPSGLHFAQGPMAALSSDPLCGQVVHFASLLMRALIAKTK